MNERRRKLRVTRRAFKRFDRDDHGTRTCYSYAGCRCDDCRDAEADYWHVRRARALVALEETRPQ